MITGRALGGNPPGETIKQGYRLVDPVCPACSYPTTASFEWCPGSGHTPIVCWPFQREARPAEKDLVHLPHLHRKCQQCNYMWIEPCLDAATVVFE